jgi:hypothetical protein
LAGTDINGAWHPLRMHVQCPFHVSLFHAQLAGTYVCFSPW